MIKKLRIKLIAVSMASLFIVLAVIVTALNIFNYHNITKDSDSILNVLAENNGSFPEKKPEKNDDENLFRAGPGFNPLNSPETPFESRYFSVKLDATGNVLQTDVSHIYAIDEAKAKSLAGEIISKNKTKGFIGDYRYRLVVLEDGSKLVIFLDSTRSLASFGNILWISIIVALLGLASVFILVVIFSRRIVNPIAESYEKQKEFITNAGHEIKTPLAIINADAEVIEIENGENEWINDIKTQTKRLAALTNDLIFLARMEENNNKLNFINFPISDKVSDIAKPFSVIAKTEGKTYGIDIEENLDFKGDENSINKLTSILIDNAFKYSPPGGSIFVSLKKLKNNIVMRVENFTDKSLRSEDLSHFFDRFYRLDPSRNSKKNGYGIGLSVAKAIVDNHKGKIHTISKDSHYLVIEILLPTT